MCRRATLARSTPRRARWARWVAAPMTWAPAASTTCWATRRRAAACGSCSRRSSSRRAAARPPVSWSAGRRTWALHADTVMYAPAGDYVLSSKEGWL
eukprot:scaffold42394_cov39-Phaeocystis_antarctica.AAC.1